MTTATPDRWLAGGVLFAALLACGGRQLRSWEPYSGSMNTTRIAERAIVIGRGDLASVRAAGGLPLATMVMSGNPDYREADEAAAKVAAEGGGTHVILGSVGEGSESVAWTIVDNPKRMARYVVIRVPYSGWSSLSEQLTPIAHQDDAPKKKKIYE